MKKIVIKKKKKIRAYQWSRFIKRAFSAAAVACILTGMTLSVYGNEKENEDMQAPREVVTEIYHHHEGNKDEQGGCYSVAVSHQHEGDEKAGGACYQTPVYHIHQGNESESGGCYTQPVFHEHQGDEQQGGACFEEIIHNHTEECYQQADCLMTHAPDGNVYETSTDICFSHGEVTFGKSQGIATHNDCDMGQEERTYDYCLTCGFVSPSMHSYQKLICPIEEGTVTGYRRICGRDETTIDGYSTGCGKEETEIDGYLLSCKKEVEEYVPGCGFQENQLCGKMILTNETAQQAEKVVISVRLEDLTGGSLKFCAPPYEWTDEKGCVIGSGDRIIVNENGKYSVTCRLENKDVDESGLHSSIIVDNICAVRPDGSTSPDQYPTVCPTPEPEDKKTSSSGQQEDSADEAMIPIPQVNISSEVSDDASNTADNTQEDDNNILSYAKTGKASVQEKNSLSSRPETASVLKESQTIEAEEYEASNKAVTVKEEKKRAGFFNVPAAKIITVAGSVLGLIFALLLLLFYLRRSVKVLNDDGEGRMIYLGHCMVKTENDCYRIVITEKMEEKACTNRYCIRPGLFRLGKKEGEELIIVKGGKSVTCYIDKEMIVML